MTRGLLMLILVASCAGSETRDKLATLRTTIKGARDNGAYLCAPRELAMAESHAVFAEQELDEGDLYRANDELALADDNARVAVDRSPPGKCGGKAVVSADDTDHDGIPDAVDKCPLEPEDKDGYQDADGCPELDNDGDGIPDVDDRCPAEPEDKDGFQDSDGCPDPDNDGDGVPDTADKCPAEYAPHTADGCPTKKYQLVEVTENKILIKQTIFFDFNKASIKPISYGLLVEVAQALKEHANLKVRVEGHTDSRGNPEYNRKLSQNRAESVRNFLIGQGIPPERLEAMGYGMTQPIADNRTEEGRTQNRRVEFIIVSQ